MNRGCFRKGGVKKGLNRQEAYSRDLSSKSSAHQRVRFYK